MNKFPFTANRVADTQAPQNRNQVFYWDEKTPGLGVRVTKSGNRAYVFKSSLLNKSVRLTIGNIKTWSLRDARVKASKHKALIDQGIDPRTELRKQQSKTETEARTEKAQHILLRTMFSDYTNSNKHAWGDRHLQDHNCTATAGGKDKKRGNGKKVPGALSSILELKVKQFNVVTLSNWLKDESSTRANKARQAFEMLRAAMRWAAQQPEYSDLIDLSIIENTDIRRLVPKRKTKRLDVLERSQLKDWFKAVRDLSNPVQAAYLQILLLSGARRNELAELKWTDIEKSSVWVKDKVEAEGRKIPLTPYISRLINSLPVRENNPWVFSSFHSKSGHITEPRIAHNRALSNAGLPHVSLHGLRRSFASLVEWMEIPTGIVAQIMGHKPNATAERYYKHRPIELLAIWHTKYENWILEQAGIELDNQPEQKLKVVA